ncbi:hypothetical protein R1sor_001977 [Riccia sorocarpa]|uniref:Uncharacterized protein n=1 Tax=Riccia sorocarpa TaxID=122646 RepID=A0ABD3GXH2_9MARC
MLTHMLTGWNSCKKKLEFDPGENAIHSLVPLEIGMRVGEITTAGPKTGWTPIKRRVRTMRLHYTGELSGVPLERLIDADKLGSLPDSQLGAEGLLTEPGAFLARWAARANLEGEQITAPCMWQWRGNVVAQEDRSWDLSNGEWRAIVRKEANMWCRMNARCRQVRHNWKTLCQLYKETTGREVGESSLIMVGEKILQPEHYRMAVLFLKHTRFTWKDRCKSVYNEARGVTPVSVTLVEADYMLSRLRRKYTSETTRKKLEKCHHEVTIMRVYENRWRIREEQRNSLFHRRWSLEPHAGIMEDPSYDRRRVDRRQADEGRAPRERQTSTDPNVVEHEMETTPTTEWAPMEIDTQEDTIRELELLGFSEIVTPMETE